MTERTLPSLLTLATLLVGGTVPARGQGALSSFNLDKLQLTELGVQVGRIDPTQVLSTNVFAITADYGEIAPGWRVVFGVSYWQSRYSDHAVRTFLDTLQSSLVDSTNTARLQMSRVSVYDVAFSAGMRWTPNRATFAHPYVDAGIAAHVINAEGKLISGTFLEQALDQIAPGVFAGLGVELRPLPRVAFTGAARFDLLSSFRSAQLRAGASYDLGPKRRPSQ